MPNEEEAVKIVPRTRPPMYSIETLKAGRENE